MNDDHENIWYEILYDRDGNPRKVLREQSPIKDTSSGFTTYDSSHGHCGLCGSLTCRGGCFK